MEGLEGLGFKVWWGQCGRGEDWEERDRRD